MPINKKFQLRVEILDELLSSLRRRNFEELLELLNDRLMEVGEKPIKKRTLYNDINYLIDKKGAPIHRATKPGSPIYYTEKFSIKNVPISDEDVSYLQQAIDILRKATDLNIIDDVDQIIAKLANKVHTNVPNSRTMIAFEEHTKALGQEYIDDLFTAIRDKCVLKITYQPFGKEARVWAVHPYMLKEYRDRWFLLCRRAGFNTVTNLALDRIIKISNCLDPFQENDLFDPDTYFYNLIGVTIPEGATIERIIVKVKAEHVDYIRTKPIHKYQQLIKQYEDGCLELKMELYINNELKSYFLSYGPRIEVIAPLTFRNEIKQLLEASLDLYTQEINLKIDSTKGI